MRIIYTDEAGITAPEPVSVVASLIVNPDIHWFPVTARLHQIWDENIPGEYRHQNQHVLHNDFTFHAKRVSDGTKYPHWREESRRALLKSMMAIPAEFEIPITFAAIKRGACDWSSWPEKEKKRMTAAKSDHMVAFATCVATANDLIRTTYKDELAQVVADDNVEMREILRIALNSLQARALPIEFEVQRGEWAPGVGPELSRADRIIDEVYYLERRNAPFLQIVDACAFGLRRYLSGQSLGEEYLHAISSGKALKLPDGWTMFFCAIHDRGRIILPPWRRRS